MINVEDIVFDGYLATSLQQSISNTMKSGFEIHSRSESWCVGRQAPIALDELEVSRLDMKQKNVGCGVFIAGFSRDLIVKIITKYSPNVVPTQAMIEDAVGEVTNMIYGGFKTAMNKMGYHFEMNLPHPLYDKGEFVERYKDKEKVVQPFSVDDRLCRVIIAKDF